MEPGGSWGWSIIHDAGRHCATVDPPTHQHGLGNGASHLEIITDIFPPNSNRGTAIMSPDLKANLIVLLGLLMWGIAWAGGLILLIHLPCLF